MSCPRRRTFQKLERVCTHAQLWTATALATQLGVHWQLIYLPKKLITAAVTGAVFKAKPTPWTLWHLGWQGDLSSA